MYTGTVRDPLSLGKCSKGVNWYWENKECFMGAIRMVGGAAIVVKPVQAVTEKDCGMAGILYD